MSRKREKRRGKEAEMARQLGVKSLDDKARELVAKGRVGHVELRSLSVVCSKGPKGLLARFRRHQVQCALGAYLVDGHGVHLVTHQVFEIDPTTDGTVALDHVPHPKVDVRYERPAHFVVVLEVGDLASVTSFAESPDGLSIVTDDDKRLSLDDKALLKDDRPHAVKIVGASGEERAAAIRSVAGVHKANTTESFQVCAQEFEFDFSVAIRL